MALLLLLAGCPGTPGDSGSTTTTPCPMLDCRDEVTASVRYEAGGTTSAFTLSATFGDGVPQEATCPGAEVAFGYCDAERFHLWTAERTFHLTVVDTACTAMFAEDVSPAYTQPYDSPECGHYCDVAELSVVLEPADFDCGG